MDPQAANSLFIIHSFGGSPSTTAATVFIIADCDPRHLVS
jgi:hypothetical protein